MFIYFHFNHSFRLFVAWRGQIASHFWHDVSLASLFKLNVLLTSTLLSEKGLVWSLPAISPLLRPGAPAWQWNSGRTRSPLRPSCAPRQASAPVDGGIRSREHFWHVVIPPDAAGKLIFHRSQRGSDKQTNYFFLFLFIATIVSFSSVVTIHSHVGVTCYLSLSKLLSPLIHCQILVNITLKKTSLNCIHSLFFCIKAKWDEFTLKWNGNRKWTAARELMIFHVKNAAIFGEMEGIWVEKLILRTKAGIHTKLWPERTGFMSVGVEYAAGSRSDQWHWEVGTAPFKKMWCQACFLDVVSFLFHLCLLNNLREKGVDPM